MATVDPAGVLGNGWSLEAVFMHEQHSTAEVLITNLRGDLI